MTQTDQNVEPARARPDVIKAVPVRHPGRWLAVAALTVLAMLIGIALGIVLAVMRLSPNPILRAASWLYTWFFRAVPRLVLAILFGNLLILWPRLSLGIPFDTQLGRLF